MVDLPNAYVPTPQATDTGHGGQFATAQTGGALRLLVVEDHEPTLGVVTKLLQRAGHHVATAQTISAALAAAESAEFDVVISDLGLPDGTGVELMIRLRTDHPDLRGIALSGYGMEQDIRRSLDAGFETHLTKPVNFDQLRQALDHLRYGTSARIADGKLENRECGSNILTAQQCHASSQHPVISGSGNAVTPTL